MQYPGVTDNLVAVKDYGIFQMLTRRIERADIVAFIIPWVFNKLDAVIASCPFIKLFLQIAYNDIYLIDAVCMERFDYRVDHTHSVYRNQRLRRGKRHGLKALADTRRDYTSPIFDFVNYNEPARVLTGDNALGITIEHSQSYRTYFDWDAAAGKYLMSQYSYAARDILPSTDANNGTQLSFDNVIVLFTDFDVYPDPGGSGYDLQKVDYTFGGVGYYFNGGKAEPIRWKKGSPLEALYLVDTEGNETSVKVNPGKTYLAVVDLEEAGKFSYDAGAAATDTAEVPTGDNSTLENFEETDG